MNRKKIKKVVGIVVMALFFILIIGGYIYTDISDGKTIGESIIGIILSIIVAVILLYIFTKCWGWVIDDEE